MGQKWLKKAQKFAQDILNEIEKSSYFILLELAVIQEVSQIKNKLVLKQQLLQ